MVQATSVGATGLEGDRRRPSTVGMRFLLRSGTVIDGMHGLACCPLCGLRGARLDARHVLGGECTEGATAEERAHMAELMLKLHEELPLKADEHKDAGLHDAALSRELRLAARVLGGREAATAERGEAADEEWWQAARLASGMPPQLGPRSAVF